MKHIDADNLQNASQTFRDLMDFFETGHHEVNADCDPDLGFDGVLGRAEERFDAEVLFDPLEEEFDVPTALVERGNSRGRESEMVGQKDQNFSGFRIAKADSPQLRGIEHLAARPLETNNLVAFQNAGPINRAGLSDMEAEVGFCPHDEVGLRIVKLVQAVEVNVSTIHDIDAAGLGRDLVENIDVMHASLGDADENGDRTAQVDHRVHLDSSLGCTKVCPGKQRQTQVDRRRVQGVNHLVDLQIPILRTIKSTGFANKHLSQSRKNAPITILVGVGQIGTSYCSSNPHRVEVSRTSQACFDVSQPFPESHLGKGHG